MTLQPAARWNFHVGNIRVIGKLGADADGKSGVVLAAGETTACEYSNKHRQYCPPVATTIFASGTQASINTSVSMELTGRCRDGGGGGGGGGGATPQAAAVALVVNLYCTEDGKVDFKEQQPTLTFDFDGPCTATTAAANAAAAAAGFNHTVKVGRLPGQWLQITASNKAAAVEDLELRVALDGNPPGAVTKLG